MQNVSGIALQFTIDIDCVNVNRFLCIGCCLRITLPALLFNELERCCCATIAPHRTTSINDVVDYRVVKVVQKLVFVDAI